MKITGTIVNIILTAAMLVFGLLYFDSCNKVSERTNMANAAMDTLEVTRNKLGQEEAKINVMVGSRKKDLLELVSANNEIKKLQKLVRDQKGKLITASVLLNETKQELKGVTEVVESLKDTVRINDSTIAIYPTYMYSDSTEWHCFDVKMSKDSTYLNYSIRNRFLMTQKYEKSGFLGLGKKTMVATIVNENPNTFTKEYRTFTVKCDCNKGKWALKGALGGILIKEGIGALIK